MSIAVRQGRVFCTAAVAACRPKPPVVKCVNQKFFHRTVAAKATAPPRGITGAIERCGWGTSLTSALLKEMFEKKIHAVVVKNFTDSKICNVASQKLMSSQIKEYTNAPGIGRVGISFFETSNNHEMEKAYFDQALKNINDTRKIFHPHPSPMDRLRLILDEIWPAGSNLDTRNRQKMFVGLCRSLENSREILPHEDVLERDDPSNLGQPPLKVQIAANVYLQVPEKGGELELYPTKHTTELYDALRKNSYGISRDKLPKPMLTIKPETGDLVIFDANHTHSVAKVEGVVRLTISNFIGYRGDDYPLKVWS